MTLCESLCQGASAGSPNALHLALSSAHALRPDALTPFLLQFPLVAPVLLLPKAAGSSLILRLHDHEVVLLLLGARPLGPPALTALLQFPLAAPALGVVGIARCALVLRVNNHHVVLLCSCKTGVWDSNASCKDSLLSNQLPYRKNWSIFYPHSLPCNCKSVLNVPEITTKYVFYTGIPSSLQVWKILQ